MAEDFSRSIARVVTAQIAEGAGFDACQDSAIEILGDLLLRYLSTICASSHSYAELAGRSQSNLADVLLALEELGVTADDLHQHMDLQRADVPFAHTLAPYPVHTQRPMPPTFADQKEPHPAHIPSFLPAFPDPHTYQHTAAHAGHDSDPYKQRQIQLEAKQKAEAALNKLHQRMSSKVTQPDTNPFLAPPTIEQLPAQLPALPAAVAGTAAAAGSGGSAAATQMGVSEAAEDGQKQQQQQQQPQPLQQQLQLGELDEDSLFEQAAVLKAFSSIISPELIAKQLHGSTEAQQQSQQQQQQEQEHDLGVIEEQPMDVDQETAGADATSSWLGWKQQQEQQKPGTGIGSGATDGAVAETEVLRFGIDPLAAGKRAALSLASKQRPADAYAERGKAAGPGVSSRQRKSKYDADPKLAQAEGILGAGPEAVFNAVGGMHAMFDTGDEFDKE